MNDSALRLRAAPPLLIGATLIVWGWQCQLLPYAFLMALLVESTSFVSLRWAITDKEFNTLSDFSGVMFAIATVYIFSSEGTRGIFIILKVLPFILFPLLLVQKYSGRGMMKLSALLVSLRKLDPALSPEANTLTDISLPFFVVCLVSASVGNQRTIVFFIVVAILIGVVLWSVRPKRYSAGIWLITIALAFSTAYATQIGLRQLQASVEASFLGIFDQFMWRYRDPNRSTTAIGSLRRLKLSDRIVLRLKTENSLVAPMLLREASYRHFGHGIWSNQQSEFSVIDQNSDASWTLTEGIQRNNNLTISTYMIREKGVIPLPHGSSKIKNVTAIEIARNPHGTVLMDIREGWIHYDAEYGGGIVNELPPDDSDLFILNYYKKDFARLADELGLSSMSSEQAVDTVYRFFEENFTYSLNRKQRYPKGKYLYNFLYNTRQGHCEYFATATALLLRSVGIPTRYAVGFSVDEYSTLEGQYIARARDAHSWTLVYVNNQWTVLDTTPAMWAPYEDENASAIEPLMDIWSWVSYTWSRWQSDDVTDDEENTNYLMWLLIPLIAVLAWRIYFRDRIHRNQARTMESTEPDYPGTDSNFYKLVEIIESTCMPRQPGETLLIWLKRIENSIKASQVYTALDLHYRYRFDPAGISTPEHSELKQLVLELISRKEDWLPDNHS